MDGAACSGPFGNFLQLSADLTQHLASSSMTAIEYGMASSTKTLNRAIHPDDSICPRRQVGVNVNGKV